MPAAAVKQKAKEGLVGLGGALFYPTVNAAPVFLVFVCGWYAPAALEKKKVFFFWTSKERDFKVY